MINQRILRLNDVKATTGLSRSSIYLAMNEGHFPRAVKLGARAIGWPQAEIDAWVSDRIERSRNQGGKRS